MNNSAGIGSGLTLGFLDADSNSVIENNSIENNIFNTGINLGGGIDFTYAKSPKIINNKIKYNKFNNIL